jgi:hypothetical protein
MNHPEATQQALSILRSGETFQWYILPLFVFVLYIYFNEISSKNWKGVAAGLVMSKLLPADPKAKILGINNRLVFAIGNAAFAGFLEIFLAKTPAFVWVYPWWGAFPVFVLVYVPFFLAAFYCYDWKPSVQKRFIGALFAVNVLSLIIFAGFLKWI